MEQLGHNPESTLADAESEAAALGAVFLTDVALGGLLDLGLEPDHFWSLRHGAVYRAMVQLHDAGRPVDLLTVKAHLAETGKLDEAGGEVEVEELAGLVPMAGNVLGYGRTVRDLARWRARRHVAYELLHSSNERDGQSWERAETRLGQLDEHRGSETAEPDELAAELFAYLEAGEPETFKFPFAKLNDLTAGGMRRGQLTLLAGWPKMGKSVVLDQILSSAAREGLRVHLFINEMTRAERTARLVSRMAVVPFKAIMLNRLTDAQRHRALQAMAHVPFGITDCAGWTAADVARRVRRQGYDVVGVDIFNRFPARDLADWEEISRMFNVLAKPAHGNCHVLLTAHLNRSRAGQTMVLPPPALGDLRSTAMLANDPDHVLFVHREQDEQTGQPLRDGAIRLAAGRNAEPGGFPVEFDGQFMRFVEV